MSILAVEIGKKDASNSNVFVAFDSRDWRQEHIRPARTEDSPLFFYHTPCRSPWHTAGITKTEWMLSFNVLVSVESECGLAYHCVSPFFLTVGR